MNDRRRVAKTPLLAVRGNGLSRVLPDTAPAFIEGRARGLRNMSNDEDDFERMSLMID